MQGLTCMCGWPCVPAPCIAEAHPTRLCDTTKANSARAVCVGPWVWVRVLVARLRVIADPWVTMVGLWGRDVWKRWWVGGLVARGNQGRPLGHCRCYGRLGCLCGTPGG